MPKCKHYTDAGECAVQHMRGAGGCQGERLHCRFDEGRYCHDFQLARAEAAEEDAKRLAEALRDHIFCGFPDKCGPPNCEPCQLPRERAALVAHEELKEVAEDADDTPSDEG